MAKYVKVEKVYKMLHGLGSCVAEPGSWAEGWGDAIDAAIEELDKLPAADVRPERHGRWVIVEYEYLTCSCCGDYYYTGMDSTEQAMANLIDGEIPKYCPNCGAKMDGEHL